MHASHEQPRGTTGMVDLVLISLSLTLYAGYKEWAIFFLQLHMGQHTLQQETGHWEVPPY